MYYAGYQCLLHKKKYASLAFVVLGLIVLLGLLIVDWEGKTFCFKRALKYTKRAFDAIKARATNVQLVLVRDI